MKWEEESLVPTHIEVVWHRFQDRSIGTLLPHVVHSELIEGSSDTIGAKHRQTCSEGGREITYVVETTDYRDEPSQKVKQISFEADGHFAMTLRFTLIKLNENETQLIYEGEKKPVSLTGKLKLKFSAKRTRDQLVRRFVHHLRQETGA
ncbi:SRPBCC family protein [Bacillus daqingensis]|uniref:SRPBCC family protein n=1 Tax=Bacillus daqingensis TaxID=872396 RepID=A0ABV9NW40_9BACI